MRTRVVALLAVAAAFRPAPPRRGTPPLQAASLEEAVRRKLQEAQRLDARHAGPVDARSLARSIEATCASPRR